MFKRLTHSYPPKVVEAIAACRSHFLLALALSALINVLYLAPTIYMMQVYDRVVPTGGIATLLALTVVVGLALATLSGLDAVRGRILARSAARLDRLLAHDIIDQVIRENGGRGPSLSQAMREFDHFRQVIGGPAVTILCDAPWTPIFLLVATLIHPVLGGMVLLGGAILLGLAYSRQRESERLSDVARDAQSRTYAIQEATHRRTDVVRALGMREAVVAQQLSERREGLAATSDLQRAAGRYNAGVKFVRMFMQSLALGVGAWLAVDGQISTGAIIAGSVLLSRALQPVEQLVAQWSSLVQLRQTLTMLGQLFEARTGPAVHSRVALPTPRGSVTLESTVVRDPTGDTILLRNVSLKLNPGELLGALGPSGAGKTTLARVIAGAIAPEFGEIRIDGARYDQWDSDELGRHIGYLPQGCDLLPGSVADNISRFACQRGRARDEVDAEVIAAATKAGIHGMILQLADGYETVIGNGSRRLSAGQAQRVALARALYGDPTLLVLDEPNSALDGEGEVALMRSIEQAKDRGATVFVIAHRTNILATADQLVVLNNGEIAELGSRDHVLGALNARAGRPAQSRRAGVTA